MYLAGDGREEDPGGARGPGVSEFQAHGFPRVKLYSIVASREWKSLRTLTLRRNDPQLTKVLADANIASICVGPRLSPLPRALPRQDFENSAASESTSPSH
jgi:hypothetical protein